MARNGSRTGSLHDRGRAATSRLETGVQALQGVLLVVVATAVFGVLAVLVSVLVAAVD